MFMKIIKKTDIVGSIEFLCGFLINKTFTNILLILPLKTWTMIKF